MNSKLAGRNAADVRRRSCSGYSAVSHVSNYLGTYHTAGLGCSRGGHSSIGRGSFVEGATVGLRRTPTGLGLSRCGSSKRMMSDEGSFSGPEAPPAINGASPVGPLTGSEQVCTKVATAVFTSLQNYFRFSVILRITDWGVPVTVSSD